MPFNRDGSYVLPDRAWWETPLERWIDTTWETPSWFTQNQADRGGPWSTMSHLGGHYETLMWRRDRNGRLWRDPEFIELSSYNPAYPDGGQPRVDWNTLTRDNEGHWARVSPPEPTPTVAAAGTAFTTDEAVLNWARSLGNITTTRTWLGGEAGTAGLDGPRGNAGIPTEATARRTLDEYAARVQEAQRLQAAAERNARVESPRITFDDYRHRGEPLRSARPIAPPLRRDNAASLSTRWTMAEGEDLIRVLNPMIVDLGFRVSIVGGVVRDGFSDRDLDLRCEPVDEAADNMMGPGHYIQLYTRIRALWGQELDDRAAEEGHWLTFRRPDNCLIDFFTFGGLAPEEYRRIEEMDEDDPLGPEESDDDSLDVAATTEMFTIPVTRYYGAV